MLIFISIGTTQTTTSTVTTAIDVAINLFLKDICFTDIWKLVPGI